MATVRLPPFHMPVPPKSGAPVTVTVPLSTVTSTLLTAGSAGGSGPSSVSVGVPLLVTVTALVAAAGAWVLPLWSQLMAAAMLKLWPSVRAVVPLLSHSAATAARLAAAMLITTPVVVGVPVTASPWPSV